MRCSNIRNLFVVLFVFVIMSVSVLAVAQDGAGGSDSVASGSGESGSNGSGNMIDVETQQKNQGEETQIQNQVKVQTGEIMMQSGERLQIQEQSGERLQLKSGDVSAGTSMQMTQEQTQEGTKLKVKLSNGANSEVKIMPNVASEKAMERLRIKVCSEENGCNIELKEVGNGEQVKVVYEVQAQKQARFLGIFKTQVKVQAQINAENGEVVQSKKSWWAFLATESDE